MSNLQMQTSFATTVSFIQLIKKKWLVGDSLEHKAPPPLTLTWQHLHQMLASTKKALVTRTNPVIHYLHMLHHHVIEQARARTRAQFLKCIVQSALCTDAWVQSPLAAASFHCWHANKKQSQVSFHYMQLYNPDLVIPMTPNERSRSSCLTFNR